MRRSARAHGAKANRYSASGPAGWLQRNPFRDRAGKRQRFGGSFPKVALRIGNPERFQREISSRQRIASLAIQDSLIRSIRRRRERSDFHRQRPEGDRSLFAGDQGKRFHFHFRPGRGRSRNRENCGRRSGGTNGTMSRESEGNRGGGGFVNGSRGASGRFPKRHE